MEEGSRMIWTAEEHPNQWVCFRRRFQADAACAHVQIAVDSKYLLVVNGRLAVFDGGLNRGPTFCGGYYEEADISPFLRRGENLLCFLVWYWGNQGRCNLDSGCPGLMYAVYADGKRVASSGEETLALEHPAFLGETPPYPSYLYGGYNITFDAGQDIGGWYQPGYDDSAWKPARIKGRYPRTLWGKLEPRPIPLFRFGEVQEYERVEYRDGKYYCRLPYAAHVSPYLYIGAAGAGKVLDIRTDRYEVHGGPGDEGQVYRGQRIEYITRPGAQEFLAQTWYLGEEVVYTIPDGVDDVRFGYMESDYACDVVCRTEGFPDFEKRLLEKSIRTLKVCMRDNFMDCPDRERGQWIGDVSVQAPQVFHVLDARAQLLLKKAIRDFIRMRRGDVLQGNVPGSHASELPSQSLLAIGEYGMIACYVRSTGDAAVLSECYDAAIAYLKLWKLQENGLLCLRKGDWAWYDHRTRVDGPLIEHCLYYMALSYWQKASERLGKPEEKPFLEERMQKIRRAVSRYYRREDGYASGEFPDERANALAVLSGIAAPEEYPAIARVLTTSFHCSPYMEYFVLEALCRMGYKEEAYSRMKKRYAPLVENENTTLWEDFDVLGTRNHAWSGGPLTILLEHFYPQAQMPAKGTG